MSAYFRLSLVLLVLVVMATLSTYAFPLEALERAARAGAAAAYPSSKGQEEIQRMIHMRCMFCTHYSNICDPELYCGFYSGLPLEGLERTLRSDDAESRAYCRYCISYPHLCDPVRACYPYRAGQP